MADLAGSPPAAADTDKTAGSLVSVTKLAQEAVALAAMALAAPAAAANQPGSQAGSNAGKRANQQKRKALLEQQKT